MSFCKNGNLNGVSPVIQVVVAGNLHNIFVLGFPGKYLYLSPQNPLHVGGRHVVGFLDLFVHLYLEVQDKNIVKYCI